MIRTSTAMAKEPLCPLIMKGFPILFLELSVLFPCLKGTRIVAGSDSFEGAFLGHLVFRVRYLTSMLPCYLYSWSQQTWKLVEKL